ncbi:hypothetical protein [Spirulina subsalsa]|uniref:hypothetical protein n=1 Tax=Spirulina subsalsa TaxID=54311 RepID=UPI0003067D95|nr:hypothetical protein [Spirulina subsalsa]
MKPKFRTTQDWEQAQLLMQPILIRVVDNLRKQLDSFPGKSHYEEVETPYPGHQLCLTHENKIVRVNLWELCFQVCFIQYEVTDSTEEKLVEIDTRLLDENGEVDWEILDDKVQQVIGNFFRNLLW